MCSMVTRTSNTRCYCYVTHCPMCCSVGSERHRMLQETKRLVQQYCKDEWLVLVEVPLTAVGCKRMRATTSKTVNATLHLDVLLALNHPGPDTCLGDCMIGVELDGTSHYHAFPVHGSRCRGNERQDMYDDNKNKAVSGYGMACVRFSASSQHDLEFFRATLKQEMRRCEMAGKGKVK